MGPETIAALIKAAAPDHEWHGAAQFTEYDGIDRKVRLLCACGVSLSIPVPVTPQPSLVVEAPAHKPPKKAVP